MCPLLITSEVSWDMNCQPAQSAKNVRYESFTPCHYRLDLSRHIVEVRRQLRQVGRSEQLYTRLLLMLRRIVGKQVLRRTRSLPHQLLLHHKQAWTHQTTTSHPGTCNRVHNLCTNDILYQPHGNLHWKNWSSLSSSVQAGSRPFHHGE